MADICLLTLLVTFTIVDVTTRSLPPQILIPSGAMLIGGYVLGFWQFSVLALIVPFAAALLANLPGGDAKAVMVLGGMVGWPASGYMIVALLAGTLLIMETIGRRRSLLGFPWMPFVCVAVTVARRMG